MKYWLYKCNTAGGPTGSSGHWASMVFSERGPVEFGGHYSTHSPYVSRVLNEEVRRVSMAKLQSPLVAVKSPHLAGVVALRSDSYRLTWMSALAGGANTFTFYAVANTLLAKIDRDPGRPPAANQEP